MKLKIRHTKEKLQNSKHQAIKILTTLYPSTILKYFLIDGNENQHNEHEDLVSHSTSQPQNSDRV